MESSIDMNGTLIEENRVTDDTDGQPIYELDKYGSDLSDHYGIKWIYLLCPYCEIWSKFKTTHTAIVEVEYDHYFVIGRDFHHLCQCEHCKNIIYVECSEADYDPDWYFTYNRHYPISIFHYSENEWLLPKIVLHSLIEAHKCLSAGANFATVVMCRRLVETILKDKGVSNKNGFKKAIQSLISNHTVHESMMHLVVLLELVGNMEVSTYELNIKDEQAKETYELTKTLIDMVYLFPKLLERKKENINEEDDFIF